MTILVGVAAIFDVQEVSTRKVANQYLLFTHTLGTREGGKGGPSIKKVVDRLQSIDHSISDSLKLLLALHHLNVLDIILGVATAAAWSPAAHRLPKQSSSPPSSPSEAAKSTNPSYTSSCPSHRRVAHNQQRTEKTSSSSSSPGVGGVVVAAAVETNDRRGASEGVSGSYRSMASTDLRETLIP